MYDRLLGFDMSVTVTHEFGNYLVQCSKYVVNRDETDWNGRMIIRIDLNNLSPSPDIDTAMKD